MNPTDGRLEIRLETSSQVRNQIQLMFLVLQLSSDPLKMSKFMAEINILTGTKHQQGVLS